MSNNKKKLLIYAHYYSPDVASTGQILQDLAEELIDVFDVTVICTVPSYSGKINVEYKGKRVFFETINGVNVVRVSVPEFSKKSKLSRVLNILVYFFNARHATKLVGNQDIVFALSQPPILGGILGLYGKRVLKNNEGNHPKFVYQIQDFNPEQIEAVGYFKNKLIINFLKYIDKRTCRIADLVITVGRDLIDTLIKRFNNKDVPNHVMINNWIDDEKVFPLKCNDVNIINFKIKYDINDSFVIMYSGNIGLYYDLLGIINVVKKFKGAKTIKGKKVIFAFVGNGSVLDKLKEFVINNDLNNVVFIPYQNKDDLVYSLNAADVQWCINARGIKGVSVPSKFYGIVAVAKPVLGVLETGSEVELLIEDIKCGLCSEPGDYKEIENNINWFINNSDDECLESIGRKGYEYLKKYLSKNISINKYKSVLLNL